MGILRHALFGVAQADLCQQGEHLLVALGAGHLLVELNDLSDLRPDGLHRVERITRILRYQANSRAAKGIEALRGPSANLLAVERYFSRIAPGVIGQQANDRLRRGRLAGSGFADERQHFPSSEREADVMHHLSPLASGTVANRQIFY